MWEIVRCSLRYIAKMSKWTFLGIFSIAIRVKMCVCVCASLLWFSWCFLARKTVREIQLSCELKRQQLACMPFYIIFCIIFTVLYLQLDASKYSWKCSIPLSIAPHSNGFVNICVRLNKLNTYLKLLTLQPIQVNKLKIIEFKTNECYLLVFESRKFSNNFPSPFASCQIRSEWTNEHHK